MLALELESEGTQITNMSLQADEIQALDSIFGDDWVVESDVNKVYSINISNGSGNRVYLQVTLPENYPLDGPPIYQISAPWMSRSEKCRLCSEIEDIYCEKAGESIIYLWIEKVREFIEQESSQETEISDDMPFTNTDVEHHLSLKSTEFDELPPVQHGEPIIDRQSVFQAHVARVVAVEQVKQVLEKLKENKKVATATHNIYAYRIAHGDNGTFLQDCEDDGETKAGSVLLHLLQILEVQDTLVIVSRWYGGIHLGHDRFKHVGNAARSLLCQLGLVKDKPQSGTSKVKKKSKT